MQRVPLKGGTQLPKSASSHHRYDDLKSHSSIRITEFEYRNSEISHEPSSLDTGNFVPALI